jgi:hypothetical protein
MHINTCVGEAQGFYCRSTYHIYLPLRLVGLSEKCICHEVIRHGEAANDSCLSSLDIPYNALT